MSMVANKSPNEYPVVFIEMRKYFVHYCAWHSVPEQMRTKKIKLLVFWRWKMNEKLCISIAQLSRGVSANIIWIIRTMIPILNCGINS